VAGPERNREEKKKKTNGGFDPAPNKEEVVLHAHPNTRPAAGKATPSWLISETEVRNGIRRRHRRAAVDHEGPTRARTSPAWRCIRESCVATTGCTEIHLMGILAHGQANITGHRCTSPGTSASGERPPRRFYVPSRGPRRAFFVSPTRAISAASREDRTRAGGLQKLGGAERPPVLSRGGNWSSRTTQARSEWSRPAEFEVVCHHRPPKNPSTLAGRCSAAAVRADEPGT